MFEVDIKNVMEKKGRGQQVFFLNKWQQMNFGVLKEKNNEESLIHPWHNDIGLM